MRAARAGKQVEKGAGIGSGRDRALLAEVGLYSMPGFENIREERVETPFGEPSDAFVLGEVGRTQSGVSGTAWARHKILPSELNFRANIYAFKKIGVERILSVSAVGSLKEEHSLPIL